MDQGIRSFLIGAGAGVAVLALLFIVLLLARSSLRDRYDHWFRRTFRTELRYGHRHLLALLVLALVAGPLLSTGAYQYGRHVQAQFDAAFYQRVIKFNAPLPPRNVRYAIATVAAPAAGSGTIVMKYFDRMPEDQGGIGQCNCFSFRREADYEVNRKLNLPTNGSRGTPFRYSCRFLYPVATGGKDVGSGILDYPRVMASYGSPLSSKFDYRTEPTGPLQFPPNWTYTAAAPHRYGFVVNVLTDHYGGGQNLVNAIERAIGTYHHPVDVGVDVTGEPGGMLNSNQNGSAVSSDPDQSHHYAVIGGHAFTLVAYFRNLTLQTPYGPQTGWFRAKNQWPQYGTSYRGTTVNGGGFFYVSYAFIRAHAGTAATVHTTVLKPKGLTPVPTWAQPAPEQTALHLLPPPPVPRTFSACYGCDRYVWHVYAKDTGQDLAPWINRQAGITGLTATGITAVLAAECGLFTTSTRCDHVWGGADVSFGSCQVTVQTAAGFGVGNGIFDGYYGANTGYIRNYENNAEQCIYLGGRVLANYRSYELTRFPPCPSAAQLPTLYVAWNAGPGQPCSFLTFPTGTAGANYYQNFIGWFRFAETFGSATDRYAGVTVSAKPFPRAQWGAISPYNGKRLSWAASTWLSHRALGTALDRGRWNARSGFTVTRFKYGWIYTWPRFHRAKVVDCRGQGDSCL